MTEHPKAHPVNVLRFKVREFIRLRALRGMPLDEDVQEMNGLESELKENAVWQTAIAELASREKLGLIQAWDEGWRSHRDTGTRNPYEPFRDCRCGHSHAAHSAQWPKGTKCHVLGCVCEHYRETPNLERGSPWISVESDVPLPEEGRSVLLWYGDSGVVSIGHREGPIDAFCWRDVDGQIHGERATHWMPLPSGPS